MGLILVGLGYAWMFRHVDDDAFITFRYSKHLAEGLGPVWNADQRVEGYTNFLWMLIMAVPISLGIDPVIAATLLSLLCLGLNLFLLYRISLRFIGHARIAMLCWLPVMCSHTLLFTATSGLETALNGLLWTIVISLVHGILDRSRVASALRMLSIGFFCGLATLCRMEAMILFGISFIALLVAHYTRADRPRARFQYLWAGFLALVLPWLIWRYSFYGDLLPNTFYVKTALRSASSGFVFVCAYLTASAAWVPGILYKLQKQRLARNLSGLPTYVAGLAFTFLCYVIWAGGDYLEFRILVPVLPMLLMFPMWMLAKGTESVRPVVIASGIMVLFAFVWGQGNGRFFRFPHMNSLVHPYSEDAHFMSFAEQGQAMGDLLEHDGTVRIAIGACGAIPYYSGFYGIDLYGLNEPRDQFDGYATGYGAGHAILASYPYIQARRPHLISLRCGYIEAGAAESRYTLTDPNVAEVMHGATQEDLAKTQIVELPLGNGFVEVCIYHLPHPKIEALIKNKALKIYTLQ